MIEQTEKPLVNRVSESGLITINLENYLPKGDIINFDIKDYLFMELILKEKDFREALKAYDWTQLQDKNLLIFCSTDAIIPTWAYMLVSVNASPYASNIYFGNEESFASYYVLRELDKIDYKQYEQQRVVIKGCSDKPVPSSAYVELTRKLQPYAQSIMFGEPCSTVPIFKRPRVINN